MAGLTIDIALDVLDKQIVDKDGYMAGRVDDLEFDWEEESGAPYVTTILAGPAALAARFGGRLERLVLAVHRRLHPAPDPASARISFGVVKRVSDHVEVAVSRDDLEITRVHDWARDLIRKIPGAERAPE
ncbi:MAG: hypothetical protein QOH26_359 [Actinomycetota bacterium]|nr:hypothetical protein [Actinomycetota bacterium]